VDENSTTVKNLALLAAHLCKGSQSIPKDLGLHIGHDMNLDILRTTKS